MADQNPANWMIMMYIAADDMLANFAVESLKQLKHAVIANNVPNTADTASPHSSVVVVAQFDADGRRNIPRLVFDTNTTKDGSLQDNERETIARDTDMADPIALSQFIDWAYSQSPATHYALVLWGHGPELLFDDYPVLGSKQNPKKFMSPSDLGTALRDTNLIQDGKKDGKKFDVIGIDACNMSMVELAYEIRDYTKFLIASQEEVPDFSFHYDSLLQAFSSASSDQEISAMCQAIPGLYASSYADYILTPETGMGNLTLAAVSTDNIQAKIGEKITDKKTGPLTDLANGLLTLVDDSASRQAIITARANSKGFDAGLYVDLCDFCDQLRSQLCSAGICDPPVVSACKAVADGIRSTAGCIVANQATVDKHCYGLSIYFPYLTDAEKSLLEAPLTPMVKGGIDVLDKGGIDVLDKNSLAILTLGGIDVLNAVRRKRIQETEQYYYSLQLSTATSWGDFIKYGWSRCLVEDAEARARLYPDQSIFDILDDRYSAQQCALNLFALYKNLTNPQQLGNSLGGTSTQPQSISGSLNAAQPHDSANELVTVNGSHT